ASRRPIARSTRTPTSGSKPRAAPACAASTSARCTCRALGPSLDAEEGGDLLAELNLVHRLGGEADRREVRALERDLAVGQDLTDDAGQLGLLLEDLLEGLLLDDVAVDVGLGDDGRVARLADHQRHLAEELARGQRCDLAPSITAARGQL